MLDDTDVDIAVIRSEFAELNRQYNDPRSQGRKQYDILLTIRRLNAEYHRRTGQWLQIEKPKKV